MNTTYIAVGGGVVLLIVLLASKKGSGGAQIYGADPAAINAGVAVYQAQLSTVSHLDDNRTAVAQSSIAANTDRYAIEQSTSLGRYTLDIQNQMNSTNAGRDVTLGGYALSASNHAVDAQAQTQQAATAAHLTEVRTQADAQQWHDVLGGLTGITDFFVGIGHLFGL